MELIVVLVCLALNAVFAAVEMAFVNVNRVALRQKAEKGDTRASLLLRLRLTPERTLSVLQLGITLVGAISAAAGGLGSVDLFEPFFRSQGLHPDAARSLAVALVVIPLTAAMVIVGELAPKSLALKNSQKISLYSARGLYFFDRLLSPVVNALERCTLILVRWTQPTGHHESHEHGTPIDVDILSRTHRRFVLNLVNIEARAVQDIMIEWGVVIWVRRTDSIDQVLTTVIHSGHTRLPVVGEDQRVIGLLHTKEFIAFIATGAEDWPSIVRPMVESESREDALTALRKMQSRRSHMILVKKGTKPIGIITMEDIIEEVIGDVSDEDDDGLVKRIVKERDRAPSRYKHPAP